MSSTNRSAARDKHKSDYYVTPPKDIINFLDAYLVDNDVYRPEKYFGMILDPCAGGDVDNPMSYPEAFKALELDIEPDTMDIRQDSLAYVKADYLQTDCKDKYDTIITNPPFNLAQEIIEKALDDVREGGQVIMLLRLNFFGSKTRKPFWDKNPAKAAYVHHKRISFTQGATDSIEYMHCVWEKGYTGDTIIKII